MSRLSVLHLFSFLALSCLGACGACVNGCVGGLTDGRTGAVVDRLDAGEISKDGALQELVAIAEDERELVFDSHGGIVGDIDPNCGGAIADPRTAALYAIADLDTDAGYAMLGKLASGGIDFCYRAHIVKRLAGIAARNVALAPRLFQHLERTTADHHAIKRALKEFGLRWSGVLMYRDISALLNTLDGESQTYQHCAIFSGLVRMPFKDKTQSMHAFKKQLCGQFSRSCTESIMQVPHGIGYSFCEAPPELTQAQLKILKQYSNARVGESSFTFDKTYQMGTDPNTQVTIAARLPDFMPERLPNALELHKSGGADKIGNVLIRRVEGGEPNRLQWPSRQPATSLGAFMNKILSAQIATKLEARKSFWTFQVNADASPTTGAFEIKVVGKSRNPDALLICGRARIGTRECTLYFSYDKEIVEVSFAKDPWAARWREIARNVREILDAAALRYRENF